MNENNLPSAGPLSYSEQSAWNEFTADRATFFKREAVVAVDLPAGLRPEDASRLVSVVCDRHEILRTWYDRTSGQPGRQVLDSYRHYVAPGQDEAGAATDGEQSADALLPHQLVRIWLRPGRDRADALCFGLNEMITDPASCARLRAEVSDLALGGGAESAPLAASYADYALEERQRPLSEELAVYWRQQLAGIAVSPPGLLADGPDPSGEAAGERIMILPDHLTRALRALCVAHRTSPFMVVTALVNLTLAAAAGAHDLALATMVTGRTNRWAGVLGNFSNLAVLRTVLPADPSFVQALTATKETVLGALRHQPAPYLKLGEAMPGPLPRPAIRVHYLPARAHHYSPALDPRPSGASWREETDFAGWPLDIGFAEDSRRRVAIWVSYDPRLFSHAAVAKLVGDLGRTLELVSADANVTCRDLGRTLAA
jgi:hypothetical protein